jgi:hypothetical protein
MTSNWHIHPDWDWERLARHRAAKFGYRLHRTRRPKGPNNAGQYLLIDKASSIVLLGSGFTATLTMILDFLERPENQCGPKPGTETLASMPVGEAIAPTRALKWLQKLNWRTKLSHGIPQFDIYRFACRCAAQFGYRVHRSRKSKGSDNAGEFALINKADNTVLFGSNYSATIEDILEFLEHTRVQ